MGGVAWSREEDQLLRKCIELHGEGKWHRIPLLAGLQRCRKSCRLRWLNYLRPNIKRGNFTNEEIQQIIHLHIVHGNRWSLIASKLPGRTANDVKNYWNCHLSKKLSLNDPIKSSDDTSTQNELGHMEGSKYGTSEPSNPRIASTSLEGFVPNVHDTSTYNVNDPMVIEKEDNDKLLYDEEHHMMMEEFSEDIIDLENIKMSKDNQNSWKWNFDDLTFDMQLWTDFL